MDKLSYPYYPYCILGNTSVHFHSPKGTVMARETYARTLRNCARVNLIRCEDKHHPGLRINWNKTLWGGIMLLLFVIWNATSASCSIAAVLIAIILGLAAGTVAYKYAQDIELAATDVDDPNPHLPKGWLAGAIAVFFVLLGVEIVIYHSLHDFWSGLLLLGFLVCLIGVSVTRWWAFGRPMYNRSRLVSKEDANTDF